MVDAESTLKISAYRLYSSARKRTLQWPLALLLISFFYCLPLGRFSLGGFDSDFRIFDFVIVASFGYYLTVNTVMREVRNLWQSKRWFVWWLKMLLILVLASLLVSTAYSGTDFLLPRLIRIFRFLAYLTVPFLVIAVVRDKQTFLSFFRLMFWLMSIVGCIAFLQGLGYLPNFWPDYWRVMYGETDAPVATLSPHHKHIGVVMLVGVCMGIGYFQRAKSIWMKVTIVTLTLIMFAVPLFAGTRTYLLGFVGVIPAMMYIGRMNIVFPLVVIVGSAFLFLQLSGDAVSGRVERKFEERVTARVDKLGYEGLYKERTVIYLDIWRAIKEHPYLLITGTGYQNIFRFVGANGAHNNYLQALMELGVMGFFVFLSFLALLWKNLLSVSALRDRDIAISAQYVWVALCGIVMTMFVGETFWGQAAMFTLAGQLSFLFGLAVSPLYWLSKYYHLGRLKELRETGAR